MNILNIVLALVISATTASAYADISSTQYYINMNKVAILISLTEDQSVLKDTNSELICLRADTINGMDTTKKLAEITATVTATSEWTEGLYEELYGMVSPEGLAYQTSVDHLEAATMCSRNPLSLACARKMGLAERRDRLQDHGPKWTTAKMAMQQYEIMELILDAEPTEASITLYINQIADQHTASAEDVQIMHDIASDMPTEILE